MISDEVPSSQHRKPDVAKPTAAARAETFAAFGRHFVNRPTTWLDRNRSEFWLLGPVAAYLGLAMGLSWGWVGLIAAGVIVALLARFGPQIGAETMLSLYRAQSIAPNQGASLKASVIALAQRAELATTPELAIIPSVAIAAFSAGRAPKTVILLTEGLLRRFSLAEIVAIVAHEIAHIRAGDVSYFALADTITRVAQAVCYLGIALFFVHILTWLSGEAEIEAWLIVLMLLAPFLNSQLQLQLSRQREYAADHMAAQLLGDTATVRSVALAMEPDFGTIFDDFRFPVPQRRNPIPSPVRAHMANSERVEHLASANPVTLMPPLRVTDEPLISLVGVGPIEMRPRNRWPGIWF